MNKVVSPQRLPRHLVGTRQGLFYLLQSDAAQVIEDGPVEGQDPSRARKPYVPTRQTKAPDPAKSSDVLLLDDFHFNL